MSTIPQQVRRWTVLLRVIQEDPFKFLKKTEEFAKKTDIPNQELLPLLKSYIQRCSEILDKWFGFWQSPPFCLGEIALGHAHAHSIANRIEQAQDKSQWDIFELRTDSALWSEFLKLSMAQLSLQELPTLSNWLDVHFSHVCVTSVEVERVFNISKRFAQRRPNVSSQLVSSYARFVVNRPLLQPQDYDILVNPARHTRTPLNVSTKLRRYFESGVSGSESLEEVLSMILEGSPCAKTKGSWDNEKFEFFENALAKAWKTGRVRQIPPVLLQVRPIQSIPSAVVSEEEATTPILSSIPSAVTVEEEAAGTSSDRAPTSADVELSIEDADNNVSEEWAIASSVLNLTQPDDESVLEGIATEDISETLSLEEEVPKMVETKHTEAEIGFETRARLAKMFDDPFVGISLLTDLSAAVEKTILKSALFAQLSTKIVLEFLHGQALSNLNSLYLRPEVPTQQPLSCEPLHIACSAT